MKLYKVFAIITFLSLSLLCACKEVDVPSENSPIDDYQDTTAPTIISTNPADGSSEVDPLGTIEIVFSEEMDSSTINNSTITVNEGSSDIQGTVSYSNLNASFTPSESLDPYNECNTTISSIVKDIDGNSLGTDYTFSFAIHHVTVVSTNPADGSSDVDFLGTIEIVFSEEMDSSSINTNTITVNDGSSDILGTISYSNLKASFTPFENLHQLTGHNVTVSSEVTSLSGSSLSTDYSWSFTTAHYYSIDSTTNLMWQDNGYEHELTWSDAIDYCNALSMGGYEDWTLPSKDELYDLYQKRAILKSYVSSRYWSSTTYAYATVSAWRVDFGNASVSNANKVNSHYVRCVRAGQ
jgi:methionine-rich copper-binding protein CopC